MIVPLVPTLGPQPTPAALKGAIQLGIGYAVGNLSSKPDRDVLMQDFSVVESVYLPRCVDSVVNHKSVNNVKRRGILSIMKHCQFCLISKEHAKNYKLLIWL